MQISFIVFGAEDLNIKHGTYETHSRSSREWFERMSSWAYSKGYGICTWPEAFQKAPESDPNQPLATLAEDALTGDSPREAIEVMGPQEDVI